MEKSKFDLTMQLARLHFERGDLIQAIQCLESQDVPATKDNETAFLEKTNYLLRSYAELMDVPKINILRSQLDAWSTSHGELSSRTFYTLALCESHLGNYEKSLSMCRKALEIALKTDNKEDISYAITGLAISYYQLGRLPEALKEIYNLDVFFEDLDLPQLKLTSKIVNAHIYRKMGKFSQALEILWECYSFVRDEKNLYAYLSLLFGLGLTYKESGDLDKAKTYLDLAMKSVDKTNLKRLYALISELHDDVVASGQSPYDLVYDMNSHSVVEKTKGHIDFKNQFILLEMLKLFLAHPGRVFSKEEFIETVWKQSYNPSVHDNKIYVTIKRLRKVIEPDYNKPKYLFLAKNGYYLSKDVKIQILGRGQNFQQQPQAQL